MCLIECMYVYNMTCVCAYMYLNKWIHVCVNMYLNKWIHVYLLQKCTPHKIPHPIYNKIHVWNTFMIKKLGYNADICLNPYKDTSRYPVSSPTCSYYRVHYNGMRAPFALFLYMNNLLNYFKAPINLYEY